MTLDPLSLIVVLFAPPFEPRLRNRREKSEMQDDELILHSPSITSKPTLHGHEEWSSARRQKRWTANLSNCAVHRISAEMQLVSFTVN